MLARVLTEVENAAAREKAEKEQWERVKEDLEALPSEAENMSDTMADIAERGWARMEQVLSSPILPSHCLPVGLVSAFNRMQEIGEILWIEKLYTVPNPNPNPNPNPMDREALHDT